MCNELGNISLFVYTTKIIYFYPFVNTFEVKKNKLFLFRKILNKKLFRMKINNFYFYFFLQFFTNLPRGSEGVSKIRPLLMGTIVGMPERCTCVVSNILII